VNLKVSCNRRQDQQLQQIVDKTIMEADQDGDGKLSFEEFAQTVANTVRVNPHMDSSSILKCDTSRISSSKWRSKIYSKYAILTWRSTWGVSLMWQSSSPATLSVAAMFIPCTPVTTFCQDYCFKYHLRCLVRCRQRKHILYVFL